MVESKKREQDGLSPSTSVSLSKTVMTQPDIDTYEKHSMGHFQFHFHPLAETYKPTGQGPGVRGLQWQQYPNPPPNDNGDIILTLKTPIQQTSNHPYKYMAVRQSWCFY